MTSLWDAKQAADCGKDLLKMRVYTSRLLGQDDSLVMHGGGNTSVKATVHDFFGEPVDVLYIKASGWDLATIKEEGFAPVRLDVLKRLATFERLSDTDMVTQQRAALLNPYAPTPSVEAILHAIIPFTFVDHTHADSVVAITNTPNGLEHIKNIYGDRVLIIPYVMPGFILAQRVYEMTKDLDWSKYDGIILLNHGIFTFADDAQVSYERMIKLVSQAKEYIAGKNIIIKTAKRTQQEDLLGLARLRRAVSDVWGAAVIAKLDDNELALGFSNMDHVADIATRGTLTPDHVIRTKSKPVILGEDIEESVKFYAQAYQSYFDRHAHPQLKCLDRAPRWAIWPGQGFVSFGRSMADVGIINDIATHTIEAIQWSQYLGGWTVLSEKDIFEMEYWELEQAKILKNSKALPLQGKIALVTGAASGIGRACVDALVKDGACVAALDIRADIESLFKNSSIVGICCDVTQESQLMDALEKTVRHFGGLDIVISNAGIFPPSQTIEDMDERVWDKSLKINLTSHQQLIQGSIGFLELGIDPTIIIVGSKNVPAPGPGAGAYSVAKAGLTQLARVAALELGSKGIRVNVLHPNQVFDTAIWTDEVLEKRARHYGLSVEEYKTNNVLHTEITSLDVAALACVMAAGAFLKTTGAQIPIDGGNERVI